MVKNNITCDSQKCLICRMLFLVFLAFFALSPIADAYADSLCSSRVFFNDLNDSDSPVSINDMKLNDVRKSLHAFNRASRQNHEDPALSLHALSAVGCRASRITKPQLSANDNCYSQRCFLASSDPSPPVI